MNTFIFFEAQEHAKDTNKAKKKTSFMRVMASALIKL